MPRKILVYSPLACLGWMSIQAQDKQVRKRRSAAHLLAWGCAQVFAREQTYGDSKYTTFWGRLNNVDRQQKAPRGLCANISRESGRF
jgi:hypothetical protein